MKISQGKNSKILIPLTIASIIIWGIIIYNIISYFTASPGQDIRAEDEMSIVEFNKSESNEDVNCVDSIEYEKLSRDPFLFEKVAVPQTVAKKSVAKKKEKEAPQIKYRINGIVINSGSKLVVFEDLTNNKTMFLREGETYSDINIKQISDNKIILTDRDEKKEIVINQ